MGINKNAFGKLMRMLAQYENAPSAVIREYVSNAVDAIHGIKNGHVDIIIPSSDNHEFQVKDNGCGMSYEFMDNELCNYLSSTKNNDGNSIGSKGIGSKAAFSISDKFSIVSVQDGTKTTCVYHINDDDECGYDISSEKTSEPNGTLVSIDIKGNDNVSRMYNNISQVLKGFPHGLITVKTHDGDEIHIDYFEASNRVKLNDTVSINAVYSAGLVIVQGNVWYDITGSSLHELVNNLFSSSNDDYDASLDKKVSVIKDFFNMKWVYGSVFRGLVISLPGNALTTNPSRESFEATSHNRAVIVNALYNLCVEVDKSHETLIDVVNKDMDNERFRNLEYKNAEDVFLSVTHALNLGSEDSANIKIGGERFKNYNIAFNEIPVAFEKKKDTKNSSYSDVSYAVKEVGEDTGEYEYNVSNTFSNTISVFVSDVHDADTAASILRKRRIWSEEVDEIDNVYDIMRFVFTEKSAKEGIPFWLNKSLHTVFTDKGEFDKVMQAHAERIKKEAAERRKLNQGEAIERTIENMKVSAIVCDGRVFKNSSRILLSDISDKNNVVRMSKDDYKEMRDYRRNDLIKSISLLMGIENSSAFDTQSVIIVCDSGTKKSKEIIHEYFEDYHDRYNALMADAKMPMSKARSVYNDTYHALFDSEYSRIIGSFMSDYASYMENIFSVLKNNSSGIKSKDTVKLIERLHDDRNTALSLGTRNTSTMYVERIETLEKMGIKDTTIVDKDSLEQFEFDASKFKSFYPLLTLCARPLMSSNKIDAIIDYINTCDKARKIDK